MNHKKYNYSLRTHNTMHVDVQAHCYICVESISSLKELLKNRDYQAPLFVLGGGSNVLFLNNLEGTVLDIQILGKEIVKETEDEVWVKAYAGENWHEFVQFTLSQNYGGLENLSLIPGRVGASPMQNIGAYGVEIKDTFHELEAFDILTGEMRTFSYDECEFGYRESIFKHRFKNKYIITSVTFKLTKKNHLIQTSYGAIQQQLAAWEITNPTIQDVSRAVIAIREHKLPNPEITPNTGSFFKNPTVSSQFYQELQDKYTNIPGYVLSQDAVKVPAGWLIEQAGWKGYRTDKVGVHDKQSLVLINHANGSGQEVYDLSERILQDVKQKFGIELEREVNIIS